MPGSPPKAASWDEIPEWERELLMDAANCKTDSKPMRIRCMELPMEHEGDEVRTPFIIIIDRAPALASLSLFDRDQIAGAIKAQTGARGVLVFTQEIQVSDD